MELVRPGFCRHLNQDRTAKIVFPAPRVGLQRGFLHRIRNRRKDDVAVLDGAGDIHTVNHNDVAGIAASVGTDLRGLGSKVVGQTTGSFASKARAHPYHAGGDGQDIPKIAVC